MKPLHVTITVWLSAATLVAGESAGPSDRVVLPPIVVTARERTEPFVSSIPEEVESRMRRVPGGVDLVGNDSFRKGRASNFEELLRRSAGVHLQANNGTESSKISIRGSGIQSEDTLGVQFLLDGLSYNEADGEALLEDFELSSARYVEVYRGANALRYGGLALGGAVNFVPFTGHDASPLSIRLELGSHDYVRAEIMTGHAPGRNDYFAAWSGRYSEGFRAHSRENNQKFFGNFGRRLNDSVDTRFYLTLTRLDRDLPAFLEKSELEADPRQAGDDAEEQDFNLAWEMVRLANKTTFDNGIVRASIGGFWAHRDLRERGFFEDDFREGILEFYSDNMGLVLDFQMEGELFGRRNIVTLGANPTYEAETFQHYENLMGGRGVQTAAGFNEALNAPFYLENQHYLLDELSLITGLQLAFVRRDFEDRFLSDDDSDTSAAANFHGMSPKVGLLYDIAAARQVYANVSRGFQPPSFDDLAPFEEGTNGSVAWSHLNAQKAWTAELGTRGERGRFAWDVALYHSWIRNELLELNDASGNELGTINVDRTIHRGIELGLEIELARSLFVRGAEDDDGDSLVLSQSYTLNDFHFDGDAVYGDNRIAGIPRHYYQAELEWELPCGFHFGPNAEWSMTSYPADQANTLSVDPYFLIGLRMGYRSSKGFAVFLEARNLTDRRYAASVEPTADASIAGAEVSIFSPGIGRAFYGGVSWRW